MNRFDPIEHKYYIDEIEVPNITELIPKQPQFVSKDIYEKARDKGDENHSLIKMYFDTRKIFNDPMLLALDIVVKDKARELGKIKQYETPLFSTKYMFGGKPDIIFENAIIDWKLYYGKKEYHALQLAAQYILAVENNLITPDVKDWYIGFYKNAKLRLKPVYNPEAKDMFLSLIDKHYINQKLQKYLQGDLNGESITNNCSAKRS